MLPAEGRQLVAVRRAVWPLPGQPGTSSSRNWWAGAVYDSSSFSWEKELLASAFPRQRAGTVEVYQVDSYRDGLKSDPP